MIYRALSVYQYSVRVALTVNQLLVVEGDLRSAAGALRQKTSGLPRLSQDR